MSSMTETMTMTRKAMWKFKTDWACHVPRNFFFPLSWVGGKGVTPLPLVWLLSGQLPTPGEALETTSGS